MNETHVMDKILHMYTQIMRFKKKAIDVSPIVTS